MSTGRRTRAIVQALDFAAAKRKATAVGNWCADGPAAGLRSRCAGPGRDRLRTRLVAAVRRTLAELGSPMPSAAVLDELLDET